MADTPAGIEDTTAEFGQGSADAAPRSGISDAVLRLRLDKATAGHE
jgi:hypothetical protein